jgi:hypothetical protein
MNKLLTTTTLLFLFAVTAFAENKTFDVTKQYRIVCLQYPTGGLVVGTEHGSTYPVFYSTSATTSDADIFWNLVDEGNGMYAIQNAKTKKYLTYKADLIYHNDPYRNVLYTDEIVPDSSYWSFVVSGSYCGIANGANSSEVMDVRSAMVTGTYAPRNGSYSNNELFQLFDADGNLWGVKDTGGGTTGETDDSAETSWKTEYSEAQGLTVPVVVTTDLTNPVYYHIKNIRKGTYVTVTAAGDMTQTAKSHTLFYFVKGTDGYKIFTKNGYYISGALPDYDLSEHGVEAKSGTTTSDTWSISFGVDIGGYGIGVKTCADNVYNEGGYQYSNWFIQEGDTYWNDYGGKTIGFYTMDEGSAFLFYSGDQRHKDYLASQGVGGDTSTGNFSEQLDSLTIGGKSVIYDSKFKQYMCVIPSDGMDKDYTAVVKFTSKTGATYKTLFIDGATVNSGAQHTFPNVAATKQYVLKLSDDSGKSLQCPVTFTTLPIVEINGSFSSVYQAGKIKVTQYEAPFDTLYNARLKWRGATAMGKPKKAYAIKLYDNSGIYNDSTSIDRSFFGLREDNNWILDAAYIDPSRSRNRVTTDLWNDFSARPYYYSKEPTLVNGTRGHFVEVLLNGSYVGLYCMTEKLDRKQLKLKKYEEDTQNIRGVLYKSSQWSYEVFLGHDIDKNYFPMHAPSAIDNNKETWASWEVKYPDFGDGQPVDWQPLWNAVDVCAAYDAQTFKDSVATYFDLPVFRDYYLLIELNLATDNHGKNMFLYSYNKNKYKMMSVAPWDMDGTWGRRWDGSTTYTSDATQDFDQFLWSYEHGTYTLFKRMKEYNLGVFSTDSLAYRYAELRQGAFADDSLIARFTSYMNNSIDCGAAAREQQRWAIGTFDSEITYLTDWIKSRTAYLDEKYDIKNIVVKPKPTGVQEISSNNFFTAWSTNRTLVVESAKPMDVKVFSLSGQAVLHRHVNAGVSTLGALPEGIYIVNGKKISVR